MSISIENTYGYKNVTLQMGGSDQWGNIIGGVDLVYKKTEKNVVGISTGLLLNDNGQKFGKSEVKLLERSN